MRNLLLVSVLNKHIIVVIVVVIVILIAILIVVLVDRGHEEVPHG